MRSLVTGGAGFIGSSLVDALVARGDEVVALDDLSSGSRENLAGALESGAELVVADVADRAAVDDACAAHGPEQVFHLAAQIDVRKSVADPVYDLNVNVGGTINLLEAAAAAGTRRFVFASTGGAIYGECERPATEEDPRRPLAPYGAAKLCAEEYIATFERLYSGGHVALRLGNVYGPRQDPHGEAGVVAIFLGLLAEEGTPRIFGDGSQTRDYVYVGDVVRAAIASLDGPPGVFNVGTGRETSVLELLEACCRVAGVEAAPEFAPPRQGELARNVLDPSLAERVLGVRPETAIDEGLGSTWDWIREKEPA